MRGWGLKRKNWFLQIKHVLGYTFYFLKVQNIDKYYKYLSNLRKYMALTFVQVCDRYKDITKNSTNNQTHSILNY